MSGCLGPVTTSALTTAMAQEPFDSLPESLVKASLEGAASMIDRTYALVSLRRTEYKKCSRTNKVGRTEMHMRPLH
jgi:hypothetical protein